MSTEHPTIEQQVRELLRAGWRQHRIGIWVDPQGVMFRGPHRAWEVMRERKSREKIQ